LKKLFYIVFILSYINIYPQWHLQNPYPTGNTLNAVKLLSENVGVAVGSAGTILRTTDKGTHWETIASGTTSDLMDLCFVDANNGWAVGFYSEILKTTDAGLTWSPQNLGEMLYLNGVCFTDVNNGTVVGQGGNIFRTTNGGASWTQQTSGTTRN